MFAVIMNSILLPKSKVVASNTYTAVVQTLKNVVSPQEKITKEFTLTIPSLKISSPVIANVDSTKGDSYLTILENGVAHFKGTRMPGDGGNVFIYGHSSYYSWKPGNYKEIFKTLKDIKKGDQIVVTYGGKKYIYYTTETKVVDPKDISVLKQTSEEQLTLMTCDPPGTVSKRLIVIAKPRN